MNEANQESSRMDQLKLVAGLEDAVFVHHLQLWFIDSEKSRSLFKDGDGIMEFLSPSWLLFI